MKWLLVSLAIAGCAKAGQENRIVGGITDARPRTDADDIPEPDASSDAPPRQITLTQTASGTISVGSSFSCIIVASGATLENSYYRVFTLSDFSITTMMHVTQVEFGVDNAVAGGSAGQQPATIKLGTYGMPPAGTTLDLAQVRPIGAVNIMIPDKVTRMTVPITADIAPTTSLIVELFIPDGSTAGNKFRIGVNAQGERKPGYTRAPDCGYLSPTTMRSVASDIGLGETDIVLTVTGTM